MSGVMGPGARLAEVFSVTRTETPFGGWARSLESLGWAWIRPGEARRQSRADTVRRTVETLTAWSRREASLASGRVLRLDGVDWEIATVAAEGGQVRLELRRTQLEADQ